MKRFLVAIDGPAGAGKSTIARRVAEELGIAYVDSGAMYRAIALKCLKLKIDISNEEEIIQLMNETSIQLMNGDLYLDGVFVSDELRTPEVSAYASIIGRIPNVRKNLVQKQQSIAKSLSVVMDGRDIGTHVLPDADIKIFLTASIEERATRRYKELIIKGISTDKKILTEEIRRRDDNDQKREYAPLKKADDAILVDTTHQSIEEVTKIIVQFCRNHLGGGE